MRVRLLGRPAIEGSDGPVDLRGPRQAGLLALLGTEVGQIVRTSRIEDELWDGHLVSESAVRVNVNRLRARFLAIGGDDPIASHPHGYALDLVPDDVDVNRFLADARAVGELRSTGRAADALRRADTAEAWWRGPAFDGVGELPTLVAEQARLDTVHQDLWLQRSAILIEVGDIGAALDQLERLLAVAPYREAAWDLQLYALARSGRRDEAARRYRRLVALLDTDLRITPAPETVALAEAIRSGDADPAVGRALLAPPPLSTERTNTGARARADADHRASRASGPFVGRSALLDELLRFALDPVAGVGSVAIVEGVPGIGKSRLAAELADRVVDGGGTALAGICPREGGSGLAPLADIVGRALRTVEPDATPDLEPLESLVPGSFPGARAPGPDPDIRRLQLFDAALQVLSLVAPTPVLVIVDDLHWISIDSARFLHHLMDRSSARWLLLSRTGEQGSAMTELLADVARWQPSWHQLDPLGPADVAELVHIVAPDASEAQEQVVVERAGGNPVFVTELLRHLMAGADASTVPPGIDHLVRASLGRLEPAAVRVAETLAIAQDPVPFSLLAAACHMPSDDVDEALVALAAAGLTTPTAAASGTGLSHDLITDAVDATVGPSRRIAIHTALGRAFAAGAQQFRPAALGHLLQGRSGVDQIELDELAAGSLRHLNESAAFEEALRIGTEYLNASTPAGPITRAGLDARVQLATALLTAGPYGRGIALLDQIGPAIRRSGDAGLAADAIMARGTANVADPDLVTLVHEARLVLDALEPSGSTRRAHLACWIGHHLALLGHDAEAREMAALAENEDRFDPDPAVTAMVVGVRMQVSASIAATPQEFRAAYADLCRLADHLPTLSSEAWRRLIALDQAVRDGTLDDHATAIDDLADIVQRFPRPELAWTVHAARAGQALARGQLDRADELIRAAQMAGGELRVGSSAAVWVTQLFQLQFERGAVAAMTPFLTSLTENSSAYQLTARAVFALDAGDVAQATDMAARLREDDHVLGGTGAGWALLASQVGDLAHAIADHRLAELIITELAPHAGTALSAHGLLHLGAADRTLGLAWATLGEMDRAIDLLDQAHAADGWRGARRWSGRAARAGAELRRRRGRPGDLDAARLLDGDAEILFQQV